MTLLLEHKKKLDLSVFESHKDVEQTMIYQIEMLSHTMKWVPAETQDFRREGKFIMFHPEFTELLLTKEVGRYLIFPDENKATHLAKVLSHLCDRPLRVVKLTQVRIQKQIGKTILPVGGV